MYNCPAASIDMKDLICLKGNIFLITLFSRVLSWNVSFLWSLEKSDTLTASKAHQNILAT